MVNTLFRLQVGKKDAKPMRSLRNYYYARLVSFAPKGMPAVFVYMTPLLLDPTMGNGHKLSPCSDRQGFVIEMPRQYLCLKDTMKSKRLKLLWVRNPDGLMLIFDDEDMDYRARELIED